MVEWSRVAVAFVYPFALWGLTFALLGIQLLFLIVFEVRIASSVLDKRFLDGLLAVFMVAAASQYDRGIAAPLLAAFYPQQMRHSAETWVLIAMAAYSLLMTGIAFHYSITHVTSFKGRSLLVFPSTVYDKDPPVVRKLWIKIFNLVGLTSMVLIALLHVYVFTLAAFLRNIDNPGAFLAYIAGLGAMVFAAQPIRNAILRFPSSLVLIAKINQVLAQNAKPPHVRRSLSSRRSDPASWARNELLQISRILERLARQEDSNSGLGVKHPLAAIYRAVADEIRQWWESEESLTGVLPSKLTTTLRDAQGVVITGDLKWTRRLSKRLQVFGADGKPRTLATSPAPNATISSVRTGARYVDRTLVWIKERWQAIIIVAAVIAFLTGTLNLKSLLDIAH